MEQDVFACQLESKGNFFIKLLSHTNIAHYQDDNVAIGVFGSVRLNNETIDARKLAEKIEAKESFVDLYNQLEGHFTLAVFFKNNDKLILVNDILGIQPCYYFADKDTVTISPSLRLLKQHIGKSLVLSKQAIFNYMYFHCIPSPTTIYHDVYKLEPGKSVTFNSTHSKSEEVLYTPAFSESAENERQLQTQCLDEVEKAVKSNITPNCGAFLSGGLDSSTVSGMLSKHCSPAKTFSIGFDAEGYDETPYAKITAKHFGTHHEVLYLQSEQAAQEFVRVAQYFDEPFGNSSAMAAYFCAKFAKEHGVDTLLAGDGGDELFAGNERYAKQKQFELYYKLPSFARGSLNVLLNNSVMANIPGVSKASSYVRQAEVKLPARLQSYNFINIVGTEAMFTPDFLAQVDTELPVKQLEKRYQESKGKHVVDNMLYLDWKFTLADNDLVKVNNMCKLAGVEVRYPLLEKNIVDFSCKVPADVKLPEYQLRDFYKKSCRGFLADETLDKSKHGFGLPFGVWLKENEDLKQIAMNALECFKKRDIVSESLIDKALAAHNSVHAGYYGELIWIMVVLELWLQGEEQQ